MSLTVEGEVSRPREFSDQDLASLPGQIADISSVVAGREGSGVRLRALLDAAGIRPEAKFVTLTSSDGFSASVPLAAVEDAVVVFRINGNAIPETKGGPVRFYIPNVEQCAIGGVDACANVKRLSRIHLGRSAGADNRPTTEESHEALHKEH